MKRLLLLMVIGFLGLFGCGNSTETHGQTPSSQQDLLKDYQQNGRRAAPQDAFPVLNFPEMSSVEAGDKVLQPTDWVIGVSINGEQKAYPISVMGIHELANDVVGGKPITVCW